MFEFNILHMPKEFNDNSKHWFDYLNRKLERDRERHRDLKKNYPKKPIKLLINVKKRNR